MADLKVSYLGIPLANPVVVAACSLSSKVDTIKQVEDLGAGALVIKSLFEEQILHEAGTLDQLLETDLGAGPEAGSFFPHLEPAGASTHLMWVELARQQVKLPLIASVNATTNSTWIEYAKRLEGTGVDALELNVYAVEADLEKDAQTIEKQLIDVVAAIRQETTLPFAVKISPFYSSVANVVSKLEAAGANGVVMFNRFFQPDINPDTEEFFNRMTMSTAAEMRVPLRWLSLLYGRVGVDLIANTGVQEANDIVKYLLAGATAVQVAGVLYRKKLTYITELISGLDAWMETKGYASIEDFRGALSQQNHPGHVSSFERAQYLEFLMRANGAKVSIKDS